MKKLILFLTAALLTASLSAQALPKAGVENTLWTGFGLPTGTKDSDDRAPFRFHGFIGTLQVRVDISNFTIDGMLAWGALTTWTGREFASLTFVNTDRIPRYITSMADYNNTSLDGSSSYHLNMIWHPFKGFDAAMGTNLYWIIGPAPTNGAKDWEVLRHAIQGDLRSGVPSRNAPPAAPVGFIHYANNYTSKPSLAIRYRYEDIVEVGGALPSGTTSNSPVINIAASVHPIDFLKIAAAYEGLFQSGGNFYTGVSLFFSQDFIVNAYLAINGIGYNADDINRTWGTGANIYWKLPKLPLTIQPEIGLAEYEKSDYTFALYTGGRVTWDITKKLHLGSWISFAWGAENSYWHDSSNPAYNVQDKWHGGFIFNVRPELSFDITPKHSIAVTTEFESITNYIGDVSDSLLIGFFWTYKTF